LKAFANKHDRSPNELAHAWLLAQPQVSSVISGATWIEHVHSNALASDWELGKEGIEAVNAILETSRGSDSSFQSD
jgi:aryl-alcohol dehydrogenase-like predicted oxidoreductase